MESTRRQRSGAATSVFKEVCSSTPSPCQPARPAPAAWGCGGGWRSLVTVETKVGIRSGFPCAQRHNSQQVSLGLGPLCDRGTYLEQTMTDDATYERPTAILSLLVECPCVATGDNLFVNRNINYVY